MLIVIMTKIVKYCHNVSGVSTGQPCSTHALPTKKKKNLISKELHEKIVYSIIIVQENKTEDHEF